MGRVKKAVVEKKVDDMKDYMERVAGAREGLRAARQGTHQAAASAGNVSTKPDQATGVVALAVKDYLKAGDRWRLASNDDANALSSYDVQSYLDDPKDDAVTLGVQFNRLPDGTSYPQQILLDAAAKKIQVKIVNSGYAKVAQYRRRFRVEPPERSRSGSLAAGRSRSRQSCSPDQTVPPRTAADVDNALSGTCPTGRRWRAPYPR